MRAQGGAALLAALLTVALATVLATQLIATQGEAIFRLAGRRDLAQARWLARGAADWARAILAEDARTSSYDHLGEPWTIKVPPIPIKSGANQDRSEGELSGEIVELNGCFDLNRLHAGGVADLAQVTVLTRVLGGFGVPEAEARRLASTVADWVDRDREALGGGDESARLGVVPDNSPMVGVGTLLRVGGFSPSLAERLAPVLCALPERSKVNLNTASVELLVAEFPQLGAAEAQRIVVVRNREPFRDLANFSSRFPGAAVLASQHSVSSEYFLATTRASHGEAVVQLRTLLRRRLGGGWPDILWQQMY